MFRWWVMDNYIHALAMAIRRLSDKNPSTRSPMSLLLDFQQHRDVLTREWWEHKGMYRNTRFYQTKHQEYLRELIAYCPTNTLAMRTFKSTLTAERRFLGSQGFCRQADSSHGQKPEHSVVVGGIA